MMIRNALVVAVAYAALVQAGQSEDSFYDTGGGLENAATRTYTVQKGDTLFTIAKRFLGDPYKAEVLARLNKVADPLNPDPGSTLRIPAPRFGILYSFQKLTKDCDLVEVSEDHAFQPGERFQLRLTVNTDGYLYVFNRRKGGNLRRLHPGADQQAAIRRFDEYVLPGRNDWFRLDAEPGSDELIVLVARDRLTELDSGLAADSLGGKIETLLERNRQATAAGARASRGRSYISTSPMEGTEVLAHRIVLKRAP